METIKQKRINVLDTLNTIDISFNNKLDIHPLRYLINETGRIDYLIRNSNGSSYVNYFNNIKFENGYIFDNKDQLFNFIYDIDTYIYEDYYASRELIFRSKFNDNYLREIVDKLFNDDFYEDLSPESVKEIFQKIKQLMLRVHYIFVIAFEKRKY